MERKKKTRGLKERVLGAAPGVALGLASLLGGARADAATIEITGGDVQAQINSANPGDTVKFGSLSQSPLQYWTLKSGTDENNKIYYEGLEGAVITGDYESSIFQIKGGGYLSLSNIELRNDVAGIGIGSVPFKEIYIDNVTFTNISNYGVSMENRQHDSPLAEAAVKLTYCTMVGGEKIVMFAEGPGATANSPYSSVINSTISKASSDGGAIDVPAYPGTPWHMLGNDEINNNIFVECKALSNPDTYQYYSSPSNNKYSFVEGTSFKPYLKENHDSNPENDIPVVPGAIDSIGNYIARIGDANFDGPVNALDYVVISNHYGIGTRWDEGDVNNDGELNALDYIVVSNNYGSGGSPEPATLAILGAGAIAVFASRLLEKRRRKDKRARLESFLGN